MSVVVREETYYKVVVVEEGVRYSPFAIPPYKLCYIPGMPTRAVYPLFVYSNLDDALYTLSNELSKPHEIWTCTVKNPRPAPSVLPDPIFHANYIPDFWEGKPAPRRMSSEGSFIVDELTLLSRVEVKE